MTGGTNLKAYLIMLIFLLGMACTAAAGRTIYVDDNGPADFNTIQAAIDDSNDGDTIIVQPGLYGEAINFLGKNIVLTSANPDNSNVVVATIIDCDKCDFPAVMFRGTEEPNCILAGFNIKGKILGFDPFANLTSENHTNALISSCLFQGGCGSVITGCDGTISNCVIVDNNDPCCGYIPEFPPFAIRECHGLIKSCTIANNAGGRGIKVLSNRAVTIENCILYNNGIRVYSGATVNIRYCNIQGGLNALDLEDPTCTVNWGPGNIDTDPFFVRFRDPFGAFEGDYHLKSQVGRWEPSNQSWVQDSVTSPCIDAGNPGCLPGSEPAPNGNRINMGAFGGTEEASKSPANWRNIADLTNDWVLNFYDLAVFVKYWLERGECVPSDLNRNESVDFADFCIFGQQWSDTNAGKAQCSYPANGAVILGDAYPPKPPYTSIYTDLIFIPGQTAIKHTGYFSNNRDDVANRVEDANLGPPPFSDPRSDYYNETTYYVGLPLDYWEMVRDLYDPYVLIPTTGLESLERGQFYYWTVDETDPFGNVFQGDVWEFAVQDYYAFAPSPPNEAVDVDTTVLLSWYPGLMVNRHEVYIGTDSAAVENAYSTDTTGIYKGYTSETFYQCSNLAFNTTYYWRIDELYCHPYPYCHYYKGDVWCFTTVPPNLGAIKEDLWFGIAGRAIGDLYSDPGSTTHTVVNHRQDRKGNGGRINMGAYGSTAEASKSHFGQPVCEMVIAGDINGDCKVNFKDFAIIALHWLEER